MPQTETACWLYTANFLLFFFFLFLVLRQVLVHKTNVLRLRNIPLLLFCTLFIHNHEFTFKHLCWHSITKILRNGPRAHFPFSLARPQGSDSASAPEDDELRLARPQGSDSASAPEDDELRLARPQVSVFRDRGGPWADE